MCWPGAWRSIGPKSPGRDAVPGHGPGLEPVYQPLLLDRQRRECVWLAPAALYDTTERGLGFVGTARGLADLLLGSHGLALIKNPVSSVARLADLGIETVVQVFCACRAPLLKPAAPPAQTTGWTSQSGKSWLDSYTGTRREDGSLRLLIDGDRFFPRLQQAIAAATNHIHITCTSLTATMWPSLLPINCGSRSSRVPVKVILDQMGSLGAGQVPSGKRHCRKILFFPHRSPVI